MIEQKSIVTIKNQSGETVKVKHETLVSVLQGTTVDGDLVIIDKEDPDQAIDVTTTVVFDDLGEPKSIFWTDEVPDDAHRIVSVQFFDGSKLVFSHPTKAAEFLSKLKPLLSPREAAANVTNIAEYRGK